LLFFAVEFAALCLDVKLTFVPPTTVDFLQRTPTSSVPPEVIHSTDVTFPEGVTTQSTTPVPVTQPPRGKSHSATVRDRWDVCFLRK